MTDFNLTGLIISFITGGGLVSGVIALKKDRRDSRQNDLDYTKEFRDIAREEVKQTREEMKEMDKKVGVLEKKVADLELSVRLKDHVISLLVDYVGRLRDVLDTIKPSHPLPEVPDELKEYIK